MNVLSGGRLCLVLLCAAVLGCNRSDEPSRSTARNASRAADRNPRPIELPASTGEKPADTPAADDPSGAVSDAQGPAVERASDAADVSAPADTDPPETAIPNVAFSEGHRRLSKLHVGDTMPTVTLRDLEGKEERLDWQLGAKLTVLAFVQVSSPAGVEELTDLGPNVIDPYARRGVRVVVIAERDPPDVVREVCQRLNVKFPVLVDSDGSALAQVAERRLPRTYVLDATGTIVWFDIEYSRSTRRELRQAVRFLLTPS